jgi:hypothetical protein
MGGWGGWVDGWIGSTAPRIRCAPARLAPPPTDRRRRRHAQVGLMIGAEVDPAKRDEYLMRLMGPPNAIWSSILQQVGRVSTLGGLAGLAPLWRARQGWGQYSGGPGQGGADAAVAGRCTEREQRRVPSCAGRLSLPFPPARPRPRAGAAERRGAQAAGGHQEHPERAADQRQRVHLAGPALRVADELHLHRHAAGGRWLAGWLLLRSSCSPAGLPGKEGGGGAAPSTARSAAAALSVTPTYHPPLPSPAHPPPPLAPRRGTSGTAR